MKSTAGQRVPLLKSLLFSIIFIFLIMAISPPPQAEVTGVCSNCHTMHNSQGGSSMVYEFSGGSFSYTETPNDRLLVSDCVGCHTATDNSTWKDATTGAPIVNNTSAPDYGATTGDGKYAGLAAGNFYWTDQDDAYGHNIFAADGTLSKAPGSETGGVCVTNSCHFSVVSGVLSGTAVTARYRCTTCHMVYDDTTRKTWHHKGDDGVADSENEGWYRFLSGHQDGDGYGVAGIEDGDWEHAATSSTHNEYLGSEDNNKASTGGYLRVAANTITAFCSGCHFEFHKQDTTGAGASPWIRHPSDAVIPITGEYAGYTTYNPLVPVARPSLSSVSNTVTPGTDMVMCLTCHRAHASPYYKMLRWDYKSSTLATSLSGCRVCHATK
jgi:hypothetical protein